MSEPIDTVMIRVRQNFDFVGGLNTIQIEIRDDTVINILKKYKDVVYKIILLGLLFPATIKIDTQQIFVLAKKINGVKKSILNYKTFAILATIDLNKIENWKDVKGQLIWSNVQFKNRKEINNNSHICFPFITRSFNDLTSFSIYLQDDSNQKIEFKEGEKKKEAFSTFKLIYF